MKTKTLNKIRETALSLIICAMLLCFVYLFGTVLLGVARELITNGI